LSPLTPGTQTSVTGQTPIGPVTGTAFLSSDGSFFYADLTSTNSPTQVALIEGGIPITSPSMSIGAANQVLAFNVQSDPALKSTIPFIRSATGGNLPGASVSPLYLVTPSGTLAQDPAGLSTSRTLQASLAISGTGASQQSVIVANIGLISGGAPQLTGALRGTSLLSASGTPVLISSGLSSVADGVGGGLYGSTGLTGLALAATSPFATETPLAGSPVTTYNFNHPATVTTLPAGVGPGLGVNPSSSFLPSSGYFGGLMVSNQVTGPYAITGATTFTQTGPATFNANFASDNLGTSYPFSQSTGGLSTLTVTFGGNASGTPNSTIIDGNIYGATESTGSATLTNIDSTATPGTQQLYLLSSAAAPPPTSLLTGGTLCTTCAYSQWGYWGGQVASNFGGSRVDVGNINFWVAGQPTVTLPFTGSATYAGQAIGTANNNGSQYIASGTFSNAYNFGSQLGTFTLNFDSRTLTGTVGPPGSNPAVYSTNSSFCDACSNLAGSFGGTPLTGVANGRFFGPSTVSTSPPETGGNFAFSTISSATPYTAAGVFLGHR